MGEASKMPGASPNGAPWWIAATYLAYIVLFEGVVFGATAWAVFVQGRGGWWFLLALLISGCAYKPSSWRQLWDSPQAEKQEG